jgi:hypothetical protein
MEYKFFFLKTAQIAQLVEQGTENPCVAGSNPALGTTIPAKSQQIFAQKY